jgi:hypothetical protein
MKTSASLCMAALALALCTPAQADDYGCQVLLCLANPAGPMAVSECVPPIDRLFSEMARLHPPAFPTCDFVGAGANQATQGWGSGDYCPESLAEYGCNNARSCSARSGITVVINGVSERRVWWNTSGVLLTEVPPNDAILTPNPPYPPVRCESSHGDKGSP